MTTTSETTVRTVPTGEVPEVLHELLDRELAYDPVARGGFINHLAMSLVAAARLGATDEELRGMFDDQTGGTFLVPRETPGWLAPGTGEVERSGIEAVVRSELPVLVDRPLSQFFHAVIRLELAIDAGHAGQVANALRNLADHGGPLPSPPTGEGGESLAAVIAALRSHPERRRGSFGELGAYAGQAWFAETVARLRWDDSLLADLASTAVAAHTGIGDFTTLHMVTGVRAVRALASFLDDGPRRELALHTAHAVALASAVLVDDFADDGRSDDPIDVDWEAIGRAAVSTGDPHVVKLAYAAHLEESATGDTRYRIVAARQAGVRT